MMKKKVLAFGMALAMLLTMTACCDIRDGGSGGKTELNETVEVPDPGPVASGEITGEKMSISLFAGSLPENMPVGGALKVMAEYINTYSDGTIEALAFFDTALGDATSMVQGLQQGTIDIAKESERGVVDIETLQQTNRDLISTLDELNKIRADGKAKRAAAEQELGRIEGELKQKLLEINK